MHTSAAAPLPPVPRGRPARHLHVALAAVLGAGLWLLPAESDAAPRCTSKPVVCARLAAVAKARSSQAGPVAASRSQARTVARAEPRCSSKPVVCARMQALAAHAPAPRPVLVSGDAPPPCTSKPVVCARLRHRDRATPVTLASDEPR